MPGGFQRSLTSFSVPAGTIKAIIIERLDPKYLEGIFGFLMTLRQVQEPTKAKIIAPAQLRKQVQILDNLNIFALDKIFDGEVIYVNEHSEFQLEMENVSLLVKNVSGSLQALFRPVGIDSLSFD